MNYSISRHSAYLPLIKPIFRESYATFLGEHCDSVFEQVARESLYVSVLADDKEVIAFCFHRQIACANWSAPPEYLADTSEAFRRMIENTKILTLEWVTVSPHHLGKFTRVQPGDLILGLGITLMKNSDCEAAMGFSRQDTKVDLMTTRFGTRFFGTVQRFYIPCSVVYVKNNWVTPHPISRTQKKIEDLWDRRTSDLPHFNRKMAA